MIKNDCIKNSNSIYYIENGENFCRIKSMDGRITHYLQDKCLSSRSGAKVVLYKSQEGEKCKVIKYREDTKRAEYEYQTALMWPKGTTGLLLRPKAFLKTPFGEFFIMHKYDGEIEIALSHLTINEKIEAIRQLSQGLATLHELKITHNDIHMGNILYDKNKSRFDLADFEHEGSTCDKNEVNDDLKDLKNCIESIIMGQVRYSDKRELNNLEDVIKCGFNIESSKLILDFMDTDIQSANEILKYFTKLKQLNESL